MGENEATAEGIVCPKCGTGTQKDAIACTKCGAQLVKPKDKKIILTTGQKIAAGVLILNGLVLVLEAFLFKDAESSQSIRSALVSVVIGAYLFSGRSDALTWAKIGTIVGGVLFTAVYVIKQDIFTAVFQFLFSLSLVGLLFGKAGKVRLVLCSIIVLGYFALEGLGLSMELNKSGTPAESTTEAK
jgi:hypothetical protein